MNIKELTELVKLVKRHNLTEFNLKDGDFEISLRAGGDGAQGTQQLVPVAAPAFVTAPQAAPAPSAPVSPAAPSAPAGSGKAAATPDESALVPIKSPMVGTFYRAPAPDKPPFVKVGDAISAGDTVCVVEAMKLFNEIEAEVGGTIAKVLVDDNQPIEYDQVLFLVEPG